MKPIHKKILPMAVLAVMAVACTGHGKEDGRPEPLSGESAYTVDAAMDIYADNPAKALAILDSGVLVGSIDADDATLMKARIYGYSGSVQTLDTASRMLETLMVSDYVKHNPNNREMVLDMLVNVSRRRNDYVQYLKWAAEKVDFCRQQGLEVEALRTEAEIGVVIAIIGEEEKGLARINNAIVRLDDRRRFDEMDACIIAIKRKINVLHALNRHAEVLPLARRMLAKLDDYARHPDDYADHSYRLPLDAESRSTYCNYYSMQAFAFLARSHSALGHGDSARHYLHIFEQSDYGRSMDGRGMAVGTWCSLGEFDKALGYCDDAERQLGDDTLCIEFVTILRSRALAAEAAGRYREALGYRKRCESVILKLDRKLRKSQVYHYAAHFHLEEENARAEILAYKARNNRNLAVAGALIAVLALAASLWLFALQRSLRRKNQVLAGQIAEATKLQLQSERYAPRTDAAAADPVPPAKDPDSMTDEELFAYISDTIRTEQLYLDPLFGRQTLIDRLRISKSRIGAAFSKGSQFKSLPDFVRDLRLRHACRLLTEHPDCSIADVAAASGFSSPTVFSRDFKNKYEVTPSFYRARNLEV